MFRSIVLAALVVGCYSKADSDETIDESIVKSLRAHDIDPASYTRTANGKIIAEMDMVLTRAQYNQLYGKSRSKRKAIKGEQWRWTDRTIPYEFEPEHFWPYQIKEMKEAMDIYMQETCLIFRPAHAGDNNKVHFQNGVGCNSELGMVGGAQPLNLDWDGCRWMGLYLHEIGHAIGRVHEHQLPDRDKYIGVIWDNVDPVMKQWFETYKPEQLDRFGVPYDLASVMHYEINSFSKEGKQTITTHDKSKEDYIGRVYWKMLSFSDVKVVNKMYKCDALCPRVDCPPEGFLDKNCKCITPESYYEDKCVNLNADDNACYDWAKSGECDNNPGWMSINCRKACDRCPKFGNKFGNGGTDNTSDKPEPPVTITTHAPDGGKLECKDNRSNCPTDWDSCRTYDNIVNCRKSCNRCIERCEDQNVDCLPWAQNGHCRSNPEAVLKICPKACQLC